MIHNEYKKSISSNTTLYFQEWEPVDPCVSVIALVHGLGEHSGRYAHWAELFTKENIALISFDLRGHGQSSGKRGHTSYDETAQDISLLLDEASNHYPSVPIFLYGHSLGGGLVINYSLSVRPPVSGVIATSPGLATGTPLPPAKLTVAKLASSLMPSFTLDNGLDRANLSRDPEIEKRYSADPLVHGMVSARLGMDLMTRGQWSIAHANEFPLPLLLMQGTDDHLVSLEATRQFAQAAPQEFIIYKEWQGFYHELHNEPEKFQVFQFIHKWIKTILLS